MNMKNFINDVLLEAAIDSRIESGMVDLCNCSHLEVVMEKLHDKGLNEMHADLILRELVIKDGKYPDRQAYNEEGWLVTFPSKDYRDAAIKKGTHFISDPTHGKGGMNLYYKKRGKQKRQTQQDRTISEPGQDPNGGGAPAADTTEPGGTLPKSDNEPAPNAPANSNAPQSQIKGAAGGQDSAPDDVDELPPSAASGAGASSGSGNSQGGAQVSPAANAPVAPPPPPSYPELSIKFAQSKSWTPTPHGEWRNAMGETVAVVGLTGEVVPIKHVEREEFKLFAEKNTA
jgi:hypothetical protein